MVGTREVYEVGLVFVIGLGEYTLLIAKGNEPNGLRLVGFFLEFLLLYFR